jgi:riboflavin biosynthesis pyrimidine reductase
MVEGGGRIITSFLSADLTDQLIVTICPVLVGGLHALTPSSAGRTAMPLIKNVEYVSLDCDLIMIADAVADQPEAQSKNNSVMAAGVRST